METTNDYHKNFNSEWFLETYHGSVEPTKVTGRTINFVLGSLQKYFASSLDFGNYLLDVGTGPTIWSILSASRRVERIILSDYLTKHITILKDWKNGKRNDIASHIQLEMEFSENRIPIADREAEVRSKVTGIHLIDITKEDIFIDECNSDMMFDVITSSFCFECASSDKEMYIRAVGNVSRLLKPGGYLIIMGCIGASYYKVDKYIFPVCPLTTEEIRLIYERNGFEVLNIETLYTDGDDPDIGEDNTLEDNKNVFTLLARKVVS